MPLVIPPLARAAGEEAPIVRASPDAGASACPPDMARVAAGLCVDRTEVTVAAYRNCVNEGACRPPGTQSNNCDDPAARPKYDALCNAARRDRDDHPVNCVDRDQATTFCAQRGRRLPTEAEWSAAAGARTYPWGDDAPSAKHLNACDADCMALLQTLGPRWTGRHQKRHGWKDGFGGTAPVGTFPAGASAQGVLDLAGNVSEWLAPGGRSTVAGSGFMDAEERLSNATRTMPFATHRSPSVGFRCVR